MKVRIVFNALAKTSNGTSLNNLLMISPTIQPGLINLVPHVLYYDIKKMYLQITLLHEDRRY